MADKKISQLTALSAANVAPATDVLAIVDTSATETKKITAKDLIDGALNGGTANGVLYLNGSKVATSGSALVFDGTSLGLGVTPSAWRSSSKALQIGGAGVVRGESSVASLSCNNYINSSNQDIYINTGFATSYAQSAGQHLWFTAASGTAGNAITFTQAMTLTATGQLELTAAAPRLAIAPATGTNNAFVHFNNSASANFSYVGIDNSGGGLGTAYAMALWHGANYPLVFGTNNTERGRFTAGGFFKASNTGTYASSTSDRHELRSDKNDINVLVSTTSTGASVVNVYSQFPASPNAGAYHFAGVISGSGYQFTVDADGDVKNTNNSYGAISDIKLKQDIIDAASQWDDIKALRVRKFRLRTDPTAPLMIGLIAQEAESISPGLVEESPDYEEVEITDEEGNVTTERQPTGTSTKSVKYSILYMKAIKALQEAMARIESLEAKVSALEAK